MPFTRSDEMRVGDKVTINDPDNARLHGQPATVKEVTDYGALLDCPAAFSGEFRALFEEMSPGHGQELDEAVIAREKGYTGDSCDRCGAFAMRRNGACLMCDECGASSGCS